MSNLRSPKEGELEGQEQTTLPQPQPAPPPSMVLPPSPPLAPSVNSSPAHEFSFTISLHPPNSHSTNSSNRFNLGKHTATPLDVDLAPADEIFFHGHLLPLHFLSHRPSDFSNDNAGFFPLDHVETEKKKQSTNAAAAAAPIPSATPGGSDHFNHHRKPKTFSSLFGLRKRLKGTENRPDEDQQRRGRKKLFDVARLWKKYANLIEPLLLFKGWKTKQEFRRSPHSFSGGSISRDGGWRQRWRGEYSAPASIRTSPTNSGLLVAPASTLSSSDESTMEELQNAIQAAIAHCKDSIAAKDDKCRGCVGVERVN